MRAGFHISDTRSHPANGRRQDTVGMLLRWQTSIEIPADFWEIPAEARVDTTCWGLLKQPDKQELATFQRKIDFVG
jgi:hypothetical protein